MINTEAKRRTWKLSFQRQRKIEQEKRRNGGQPQGNQPFFIVIILPYLWLPAFLRSSVPLVQSRGWLFFDFGNFLPEMSGKRVIFVLSPDSLP